MQIHRRMPSKADVQRALARSTGFENFEIDLGTLPQAVKPFGPIVSWNTRHGRFGPRLGTVRIGRLATAPSSEQNPDCFRFERSCMSLWELAMGIFFKKTGAADCLHSAMRLMRRSAALATTCIFGLTGPTVFAQGVAPGGPIGNSTGIGSGLGAPPGGTAPSYPNGTMHPTLPPPPPPGGGLAPSGPPSSISTTKPPSYPKSLDPFGPAASSVASRSEAWNQLLQLPERPIGDLSFLKGCWRSDVFQLAHESGVATYCFDNRGSGRFLYTRLNQAGFYCRAVAQAKYLGAELRLQISATTCSDGSMFPDSLDCSRGAGATAKCSGMAITAAGSESWTVHLHRSR